MSGHRSCRCGVLGAVLVAALVACTATPPSAWAVAPKVTLASLGAYGQAMGASSNSRISADGRYVVFETTARLVTEDGNVTSDVYRRGLFPGGTTELVSVVTAAVSALGASHTPATSRDGRYVVFVFAPGADAGGTYLRDMVTGETTRIDVAADQPPGPWSRSGSQWWCPSISLDGSRIAFVSGAPELSGGGRRQVFVRDMETGDIETASVDEDGREGALPSMYPSLDADGTRVAFLTSSPLMAEGATLRRVYLRDLALHATKLVSVSLTGASSAGVTSGAPSISGDGSKVAFASAATDLVGGVSSGSSNVFVRDIESSATVCASVDATGQGVGSYYPSISSDGRYVAFQSDNAQGMTEHDSGALFVRYLGSGTLLRVGIEAGVAAGGSLVPGPGTTDSCTSISSDGRYAVFDSSAGNLVAGDANGARDVFRCDLRPQVLASLSRPRLSSSSPYKNRYFYVSGTVTRHSFKAGVRLYFYRQVGKSWRYHRYVKVSTARSYKVRVRLPYRGRWYVRARHPADTGHLASSSTYTTFRVR